MNKNKRQEEDDSFMDDMDMENIEHSYLSEGSATLLGSNKKGGGNASRNNQQKAAKRELLQGQHQQNNIAVFLTRFIFFVVLISAAIALALVVYRVLKDEEMDDFEAQLQNLGNEFILLSNQNARSTMAILQGLSTTTTTLINDPMYQSSQTNSYPKGFVTLPGVHHQLDLARNSTMALVIAYTPIVAYEDHDLWVEYSQAYKGWMVDGQDYDDGSTNIVVEEEEDVNITPFAWVWKEKEDGSNGTGRRSLAEEDYTCGVDYFDSHRRRHLAEQYRGRINTTLTEDGSNYFTPIWTMSPIPKLEEENVINYNLITKGIYRKAVEFTKYSQLPSFLDVCYQANWFNVENSKEVLQTVIATPVMSHFANDKDDTKDQPSVVGHFVSVVPWVQFFINNLIDDSEKLMVVVSNTCKEVFSFQIEGQNATFLKEEDLHDTQFDHLGISEPWADLYNPATLPEGDHPVDYCRYTMTVYPTIEFQNQYQTNKPLHYALGVIGIFASTSLAFILFDCFVSKRQGQLLSTAIKQNAILQPLYPKQVREQLMEEMGGKGGNGRDHSLSNNTAAFLREEHHGAQQQQGSGGSPGTSAMFPTEGLNAVDAKSTPRRKAIADLFPETTIMFADIAGFTSWSSERSPTDVFVLLETIYAAFDANANRLGIFKVETIGDCYVAVCGLPEPRKNHATVMCRFAGECLESMATLTKELEEELGQDTSKLALRVGLHSGPVVAGVLRGEKPRFQLYGDTVNTASRMESTGKRNRVQLSQDTADLLHQAGRSNWLIPRRDVVTAKGKGEMKTYFLRTKEATAISATSGTSGSASSYTNYSESDSGSTLENPIPYSIEDHRAFIASIEAQRQESDKNLIPEEEEESEELSDHFEGSDGSLYRVSSA